MRETRRYDEAKGKTIAMRSKEQQDDYRFIAEPDLQAVVIDKKIVDELKKKLPEMPEAKLKN